MTVRLVQCGLLSVVACCAHVPPGAEPMRIEALQGLWTVKQTSPRLFDLEIRRHMNGWRATVGDQSVSLVRGEDGWQTSAPFAGGSVRLVAKNEAWHGHWIQRPRGSIRHSFATPFALVRVAEDHWVARIRPLEERVEFYLTVRDNAAFLRDPNTNMGRRFRKLNVRASAARFEFVNRYHRIVMTGRLSGKGTQLALRIDGFDKPMVATREGRARAPGYHARTSTTATYEYRAPPDLGDGWPVATLTDADMALAPLRSLMDSVIRAEPRGWRSPYLYGLLIARDGRIVLEEYFHGHERDRLHDSASATMSFASTLIGAAVRDGLLHPSETVFPRSADAVRAAMKLEDLLGMRSGLDCNDNEDATAGNIYAMRLDASRPDEHAFARSLPMAGPPGRTVAYCTAAFNLSGSLLSNATGVWLPDYFKTQLAEPLRIDHYHLRLMRNGDAFLAGGLHLRLRDFAKLGQLFLNGGAWSGRRVVTQDWVRRATGPSGTIARIDDYGLGWWRFTYRLGRRLFDAFYASGTGGQLIVVVPSLQLVIATHGKYGDYRSWMRFHDVLIPRYILAAIDS